MSSTLRVRSCRNLQSLMMFDLSISSKSHPRVSLFLVDSVVDFDSVYLISMGERVRRMRVEKNRASLFEKYAAESGVEGDYDAQFKNLGKLVTDLQDQILYKLDEGLKPVASTSQSSSRIISHVKDSEGVALCVEDNGKETKESVSGE
ncbi:hypothetical protein F2Q70_00045206 [Brassica cretica]|uniref:Uncharacterized protein n=1 Tax=Brassica cretica TaxID=69181 RepID=A0A8S9KIT9_BRACR|nr:hypothetical protein F2Q70_00045206 [Brassica cretica]KAF3517097.1 hypothetical protein DY000_02063559 [Brassica cretica]